MRCFPLRATRFPAGERRAASSASVVAVVASLPIMFCLWIYYSYRLMYRWSGDTGKAVIYTVLSLITGGLFHAIYGLMHMNQPFKA